MRRTRALDALPSDISAFFDERAEQEFLSRTLHPYILHGFKQGASQAKTRASRAAGDEFDYLVLSRLRRKAFYHATLAIGTTKEELQGLLAKAISEGQSIQQLGKAINDYFALDSTRRSKVIARTELTDTINDGAVHTIQREGYAQKEWSTVLDGRERESHHAANGQVVSMNEDFKIGVAIARYPGDDNLPPSERIQCRCTVVAAGIPDERKAAFTRAFLRTHSSLERTFVVRLQQEFARQRRRILLHFPPV